MVSEKPISTIELQEFIAEALNAVLEGIASGQRKFSPLRTARVGHQFAQRVQFNAPREISFDVATTVTAGTSAEGGASIKVVGIGVGGKVDAQNSNSTVTRIAFAVPIGPKDHGTREID